LETGRVSPSASYREQAGRRVNPDHGRNLLAIEGKVQPRADPNFEHASSGSADHLTAIFLDLVLPHDQVEDRWQYPAVIEVHNYLLRASMKAYHCASSPA
jgi:hypothetical protein